MNDIFSRTKLLFGLEAFEKFKTCKIAVVGLGGVGSYAAETLARSGIENLLLIDFDVITYSNLNRQIPALQSTIGKYKTEMMQARILDINPQAKVEIFTGFCTDELHKTLLFNLDFIVDAIDSLNPKVGLIEFAYRNQIPFISVLGAASRFEPAKIELSDISKTHTCPLARKVRKYLHRREIYSNVPVVYSTEQPIPQFDFSSGSEADWQGEQGRIRGTLGSVAYMPAIMGMWAASYVLRKISGRL
jgi:tRNA A37 threonylcarbamoyladenosine dehydratase